jgi:hypothetical protein
MGNEPASAMSADARKPLAGHQKFLLKKKFETNMTTT